MNILTIENISKSYGNRKFFDNISFSINDYDKIALIGINGTGKSTLLNLITGNDAPDCGTINIPKNITI